MRKYEGICDKFGRKQVSDISLPLSMTLSLLPAMLAYANSSPNNTDALAALSFLIAFLAHNSGIAAAIVTHEIKNKSLTKKETPQKEGDWSVKKFQTTAYAIPVLLGLTLNAAIAYSIHDKDKNLEHPHIGIMMPENTMQP
jgi:hypothetical protein